MSKHQFWLASQCTSWRQLWVSSARCNLYIFYILYIYIIVADLLKVGPLAIWIEMLPCAMGVGVAMVILSLIVAVYYNVIMAYCLHYLFNSMR